jgi:hypothetical protein
VRSQRRHGRGGRSKASLEGEWVMSLTRAEWEEMWASIKYVEMHEALSNRSRKELKAVKDMIQKVIGQME